MYALTEHVNLLVAYPYMNRRVVDCIKNYSGKKELRFLLDSGAFTAWKSGNPIELDAYCRFIESLPFKPWRYMSLDVIGDPQASLKNYNIMTARGFNPVPVFTRGENVSALDEYYKQSDLVAIGGLVKTPRNQGFVKGICQVLKGRNAHFLGFAQSSFIKAMSPYSVDSSSFDAGPRYARIPIFLPSGRFFHLTKECAEETIRTNASICNIINSYNFDPYAFFKSINWQGGPSMCRSLSAKSYLRYQCYLQQKFGVKYFMATSAYDSIKLILEE